MATGIGVYIYRRVKTTYCELVQRFADLPGLVNCVLSLFRFAVLRHQSEEVSHATVGTVGLSLMPPKCGTVLDATEMWDCPRCHRNVGLSYATELWDCGTLQKCGTVPYAIDILRHDRKCVSVLIPPKYGTVVRQRNVGLSYATTGNV